MGKGTIVRAEGEGERRWFYGGGVHTWKVSAEETGGAFFVIEDALEGGKTTPLHCHPDADELVYVLEGEIVARVDGEERRVAQGATMVVPRGVEHAFFVASPKARLLYAQIPGGGDAFYRSASAPAGDADGKVDFARVRSAAELTGNTKILGPSPFVK